MLFKYLKEISNEFMKIIRISRFDYIKTFRGSNLGFLWIFLNPAIQIATYYLVFGTGLKGNTNTEYPFFLWIMSGLIPWFFISGCFSSGAKSILSKLKNTSKMNIRLTIFPTITIVTQLYTHILMLIILLVVSIVYGYIPKIDLFYYLFATLIFLLGLVTTLATYTTLVRDLINLIPPVTRMLFWFLPVVWNTDNLPVKAQYIIQLNPIFYLINGYRYSFIGITNEIYIPYYPGYFWFVTLILLLIGSRGIYKYYYEFYENI